MRRVVITGRAERDLTSILSYIAEDSPIQAVMMVDRLERAAMNLSETASSFQRLDHPEYPELRRRVVGSYNIVYAIDDDTVEVLHFAHAARNLDTLLLAGD